MGESRIAGVTLRFASMVATGMLVLFFLGIYGLVGGWVVWNLWGEPVLFGIAVWGFILTPILIGAGVLFLKHRRRGEE